MARPPDLERHIGYGGGQDEWAGPDYNPGDLTWPESARTFERMWRTEPQIATVVRTVSLPIIAASWHVEQGEASADVARGIAVDLGLPLTPGGPVPREAGIRPRSVWAGHLPLAVRMLVYGMSLSELVYRPVDERLRLAAIDYRPPTSIASFTRDPRGRVTHVVQHPPWWPGATGQPVRPMPVGTLLWYTHEPDGPSDLLGNSVLRAAYRPWRLKDRVTRLSAVAMERGIGSPVIAAPEGATQAEMDALSAMAQAYRGGELAGGAVPYGTVVHWPSADAAVLGQAVDYLRYYDTEIAKLLLAQHLELGSSREGSRALSGTFVSVMRSAWRSIRDQVARTATDHLIARSVELNYGVDEPAPALVATEPPAEVTDQAIEALQPFAEGEAPDDGPAQVDRLARQLQQIYLAVDKVVTAEEAREILNRGGAGLTGPGPVP